MLINEFATLTKEGWEKLEDIFDHKKFRKILEEFSPLERVVVVEAIASSMRFTVTLMNADDAMKDFIKDKEI